MATPNPPKDKQEERYRKCEEKIIQDVKIRKENRKLTKQKIDKEYEEVLNEIKEKYPTGEIVEKYLRETLCISKIYPQMCNSCNHFKIYPYEFLTKQGRDNGKNRCQTCMSEKTKSSRQSVEKHQVRCKCGVLYYGNEDNYYKHINSKQHLNNMEKLVKGVRYTEAQMFQLCRLNHIPYYKTMNQKKMAEVLNNLGDELKVDI